MLGTGELLSVAKLLRNTAYVKAFGRHDTADTPKDSLDNFFDQLEPLTLLSGEIDRCIISEEEISDDASSALKDVRRQMKLTNEKVHSHLNTLVNSGLRTYLQDADRHHARRTATVRRSRPSTAARSPGMIHDQSATGSTLFVEPIRSRQAQQRPAKSWNAKGAGRDSGHPRPSQPMRPRSTLKRFRTDLTVMADGSGFYLCPRVHWPLKL